MKDDDEQEENTFGVTRYACMPSLVALQQMRNRLHLAFLGRKLMKWTALATGRELRKIAIELDSVIKGLGEEMRNAFILLARARYFCPEMNKIVLENIGTESGVVVIPTTKAVSAVKIVQFEIAETGVPPYPHLGIEKGGQAVTEAKKAWLELLKKLIMMMQLRTSFITVETANKNATKKSNVLGKIIVPRLNETSRYILSELEEMEREEVFRLKRVKQKKEFEKQLDELKRRGVLDDKGRPIKPEDRVVPPPKTPEPKSPAGSKTAVTRPPETVNLLILNPRDEPTSVGSTYISPYNGKAAPGITQIEELFDAEELSKLASSLRSTSREYRSKEVTIPEETVVEEKKLTEPARDLVLEMTKDALNDAYKNKDIEARESSGLKRQSASIAFDESVNERVIKLASEDIQGYVTDVEGSVSHASNIRDKHSVTITNLSHTISEVKEHDVKLPDVTSITAKSDVVTSLGSKTVNGPTPSEKTQEHSTKTSLDPLHYEPRVSESADHLASLTKTGRTSAESSKIKDGNIQKAEIQQPTSIEILQEKEHGYIEETNEILQSTAVKDRDGSKISASIRSAVVKDRDDSKISGSIRSAVVKNRDDSKISGSIRSEVVKDRDDSKISGSNRQEGSISIHAASDVTDKHIKGSKTSAKTLGSDIVKSITSKDESKTMGSIKETSRDMTDASVHEEGIHIHTGSDVTKDHIEGEQNPNTPAKTLVSEVTKGIIPGAESMTKYGMKDAETVNNYTTSNSATQYEDIEEEDDLRKSVSKDSKRLPIHSTSTQRSVKDKSLDEAKDDWEFVLASDQQGDDVDTKPLVIKDIDNFSSKERRHPSKIDSKAASEKIIDEDLNKSLRMHSDTSNREDSISITDDESETSKEDKRRKKKKKDRDVNKDDSNPDSSRPGDIDRPYIN